MGRLDVYSSSFWLVFSVYVAIESCRLGLGKWDDPGPGYFSFGSALLFAAMALTVLVKSLRAASSKPIRSGSEERARRKNVLMVLIAMVLYTLLMNKIGFAASTFLLILFLIRGITREKWPKSVWVAAAISAGSYLIFNVFLKTQLPAGILF